MRSPAPENGSPADGAATVDPLTGFGTRRSLLEALEEAVKADRPPALLVLLGLDGFEEYVSLFGRLAGGRLVARLAERLAASIPPDGTCYRPRQDEFAVIVPATIAEAKPILDAAVAALRRRARPVAVSATWGAVLVPEEGADPIAALRLADERLSSNAPRRRRRNRRAADRAVRV